MIHFSCKWCGKRYHALEKYAGRCDACKECGKPVYVPRQSGQPLGPALQFACPACGKRYRTHPRYAGLKQVCRKCGEMVTAPAALETAAPSKPTTAGTPAAELQRSPFELEVSGEARQQAELEALLNLPPFELVPAPDQIPDAELVAEVDGEGVAPPPPSLSPPIAEVVPRVSTPAGIEPEAAPASPAPPPASVKQGCRYCGAVGSYNLHSRSPLGVLAMLAGTFGGLAALCFVERDWRYGIAAGVAFAIAVVGAFLKRWTTICSSCERRLY